jgi:alkaline phosphatase
MEGTHIVHLTTTMLRSRRLAIVAGVAGLALVGTTVSAIASSTSHDRTAEVKAAVKGGKAKNVIMFLGDGMGDSEITVARNYAKGAAGHLNMDKLPMTGEYTTYAVQKGTRATPNYVTDSAASGTGWSTGHKTYNGAISVDPVTGKPLKTILEWAKERGYATGDVTTAELTDATPAVLVAHVTDRGCAGPADMANCPTNKIENGGKGSIAEQSVSNSYDVLLGGASARYAQTVTAGRFRGLTVAQQAQVNGYKVVTDKPGLDATTSKDKVLGLFAPVNLPLEYAPYVAKQFPANTTPQACTANADYPSTTPHLTDMTKKALSLLDAKANKKNNGKGFYLQIEGASIDKQDHAENVCGQIGETIEFDNSIKIAQQWAKSHPDTLIVVTADHGHTSQIIEYPQTDTHHSQGDIATVLTADGQPMVVSYATNISGQSQDHTGTEVRIAAQGPQAANVTGITDQTDLFHTLARAIGAE